MYNFNLMKNENIIKIFDEVFIRRGENEKITTIALTNKRLLFLEYITQNEGLELLRVARGADYMRYKEVYYQVELNDVKSVNKDKIYKITLQNGNSFEFDSDELYNLLNKKEF